MKRYQEIIIDQGYEGFNPVCFGSETCRPGHYYGPAVRTYWLLHYVVKGFGTFERDGKTHRVKPGEIFVIPPYEETYYQADEERPWRYIWIGFTATQPLPSVFLQAVIRCSGVGAVFEGMHRCHEMGNGCSAFLAGKLWELIAVLLDQSVPEADYVDRALNCMNAEYATGITVQEIADRLNLDRSYFSTIFKEKMEISPRDYLKNLRLQRAAELILRHGVSPSTAGVSVGYGDIYHFSKAFKQHFGQSPRSYQKMYKGENWNETSILDLDRR